MQPRPSSPRGMALFVALIAVTISIALTLAVLQGTTINTTSTDSFVGQSTAYYAAYGATEMAMSEAWGQYTRQTAQLNFFNFLTAKYSFAAAATDGSDPIATDFASNSGSTVYVATVGTWPRIAMGDRLVTQVRMYYRVRSVIGAKYVDLLVAAEAQKDFGYSTGAAQLAGLSSMATRGSLGEATWVAQEFLFSTPPKFNGLDYAVLTKNLTCSMCHMRVQNIDKVYNTKAANYNTFERVKVATTNFLAIRTGSAYTNIEGTLYQRGGLEEEQAGTKLTPAQFVAGDVQSVAFNANSTTVKQNTSTGAVTQVSFHNETTDGSGNTITPVPRGDLYLNYGTSLDQQTDGPVPTDNFPSPFTEIPKAADNNLPNNKVDPDEVLAAETDAHSAYDATQPGTLTGGIAVNVSTAPLDSNIGIVNGAQGYIGTSLPTASSGYPAANITTATTGNVILVGTQGNPIMLNGKVVIDGDVVIKGYVQGTGQIWASGNIYVPSDVIYNDVNVGTSSEVFGRNNATDPNKQDNLMGLVAGKNIIVGDYLSQVTHWNSSSPAFFSPDTQANSTSPVVAQPGSVEPGKKLTFSANKYLGPWLSGYQGLAGVSSSDLTTISGTQYATVNMANFTMEQLSVFNRTEYSKTLLRLPGKVGSNFDPTNSTYYTSPNGYTNPNYDPNYIPRYYSMYKYDPANPTTNPVLLYSAANTVSGSNGGTYWDNTNNRWNSAGDPHTYNLLTDLSTIPQAEISPTAQTKMNVINVHPDWITPPTMLKILSDEEHNRPATDRRVDGLLYTKNAIFCIERREAQYYNPSTGLWSTVPTKSNGYMTVNGALVGPDMGILVTGNASNYASHQAFTVNYDNRVKGFIPLQPQSFDNSQISGTNYISWGVQRKGVVRVTGPMP